MTNKRKIEVLKYYKSLNELTRFNVLHNTSHDHLTKEDINFLRLEVSFIRKEIGSIFNYIEYNLCFNSKLSLLILKLERLEKIKLLKNDNS